MESIKQIYRIGHGPSSSHTMGPMRAARMFLERNRGAVRFNVTLYGSLAATGKGHMTDAAILEVLSQYRGRDVGKRNLQRVDAGPGLRNAYYQGYTGLV